MNHLSYADDLVLTSSSVKGQQQLLNILSGYARDFDIAFNPVRLIGLTYGS